MKLTLGEKVREVRESRQIDIDQLAEKSGIASSVISQIESGDLVTSLTPLIKIARVLGVRLGTFLDDQESLGPVVTKAGSESRVVRVGSANQSAGMDFFSLAQGKAGRHMEPFVIDVLPLAPGEKKPSSHEGEEFIHVLEGSLEIDYGRESFRLEKGDSIYYDSIVDHLVRSGNDQPAKILAVVYAPF